jgi:superfamily II DNA or RNA helicase
MQCGAVRYTIEASRAELSLVLKVRETPLTVSDNEANSIQDIFHDLIKDDRRNAMITDDIVSAIVRGRQCLVLTQRKEHCRLLADRLIQRGRTPFTLSGEVGKRERSAIIENLRNTSAEREILVIATGEYLGEGFDCPRIDTLFLTFPISFKGKIVQYVGRTLRSYPGKAVVEVYDYCDTEVPVLSRMYSRRLKTYKALGFNADGIVKNEMLL